MFIPMVLFVGILNSLFNSAGATSLWKWGPFSVTVEGMCYGLAVGGMLAAILLWFSCYNEVMTEDKFTYLFGRKLPTISLMVSMISRWIPRMVSRGHSVYDSQEALIGGYDQTKSGKMKRGLRMATVLTGLGMEDSVQTADSMCARGYGATSRTSYARFKWHTRERIVLGLLIVLLVVNVVLLVTGTGSFKFYPRVSAIEPLWGYLTYALMLGLPFLVELERFKR
jgi:energy-coupling factor transport system permease protein